MCENVKHFQILHGAPYPRIVLQTREKKRERERERERERDYSLEHGSGELRSFDIA